MQQEGTPPAGAAVDDTRPFDLAALQAAVTRSRPPRPRLGPAVTPSALPPAPRSLPPVVVAPLPPAPPTAHGVRGDGSTGHASALGPGIHFFGRPLPHHDGPAPGIGSTAASSYGGRTARTVALAAAAVLVVLGLCVAVALLEPAFR